VTAILEAHSEDNPECQSVSVPNVDSKICLENAARMCCVVLYSLFYFSSGYDLFYLTTPQISKIFVSVVNE